LGTEARSRSWTLALAGSRKNRRLVLVSKLAESVVGLAIDDRPLFNPANLVFLGLDLEKAAAVFEDFERLPIAHFADAVGDSGHTVVQVGLPGGDVDRLVRQVPKAVASRGKNERAQQ
jgi:hypothetical protein